jgi:DNA-binding response OmpR family regulator
MRTDDAETILVVEGDHDLRDILREQQGQRRRYVMLVHSSVEASCVLRTIHVDAVVVDLAAPATNGWDLLGDHAGGPRAAIAVIPLARSREVREDAVTIIDEPFSYVQLVTTVDDACTRGRGHASPA